MNLIEKIKTDQFYPKVGDIHLCRVILYETDDLHLCLRDISTGLHFRSDPLPSNALYNYRRKFVIDEVTPNDENRFFVKFTIHERGDQVDANEFAPFHDSSNFIAIE